MTLEITKGRMDSAPMNQWVLVVNSMYIIPKKLVVCVGEGGVTPGGNSCNSSASLNFWKFVRCLLRTHHTEGPQCVMAKRLWWPLQVADPGSNPSSIHQKLSPQARCLTDFPPLRSGDTAIYLVHDKGVRTNRLKMCHSDPGLFRGEGDGRRGRSSLPSPFLPGSRAWVSLCEGVTPPHPTHAPEREQESWQ